MENEIVIGIVPSINFDRLLNALNSMGQKMAIPIHCYCQGFTNEQQSLLNKKYHDQPISFTFVGLRNSLNRLIKIKNELLNTTVLAEFYYFFDDDFIFENNTLNNIREAAIDLLNQSTVGAVSFNRKNSDSLAKNKHRAFLFDENYQGYYKFSPTAAFGALWTNGGILVKSDAFMGFDDSKNIYLFGDDIGIFIHVCLNGYEILVRELNVIHEAGGGEEAYANMLVRHYKLKELNSDEPHFGVHAYAQLEKLNYMHKFLEEGTVHLHKKHKSLLLTKKGLEARESNLKLLTV